MEQRKRNRGIKDLSGQRFGMLQVLALVERDYSANNHLYRLACDCGSVIERRIKPIAYGKSTISCGCYASASLAKRNTTHGLSKTHAAEYKIWKDMRGRCERPTSSDFADYGGRGIKVCARWADFAAFVEDMGTRPAGMSIDRIDVNGDYEPANCRWATPVQQANNKRSNRLLTYNGEAVTLQELSRLSGLDHSKIRYRLSVGMSVEQAVAKDDFRKQRPIS